MPTEIPSSYVKLLMQVCFIFIKTFENWGVKVELNLFPQHDSLDKGCFSLQSENCLYHIE